MNIATNISVTNTPIPIPITMPCKKASPSGSVVGRNFIQLYPYPSLHTEYTPESRDSQVFFLTFFVSIYRDLGRLLWLAAVWHVEKGINSGVDSGYPDISAWLVQNPAIRGRL